MARRRKKRRRGKKRVRWSEAHVRRLHWRAGFGARPAEVADGVRRGRRDSIDALFSGEARLDGPAPTADGKRLDPENEFGHDVLWWLDRMARTTRPLEERMTLFWHDHFATVAQESYLMLRQNRTLRERALGSFPQLLEAMTLDPALARFLSLTGSHKSAPNENFARELMELFTIGKGYTEDDVREASRALTGFVATTENGRVTGMRFDPSRHDDGDKTIFGQTGRYGWKDVLRLCVEHANHAPFLVTKLWEAFIPTPIAPTTLKRLARLYVSGGREVAPVLRRILDHPRLYASLDRPQMIKPPAVYVAGALRAMGATVTTRRWVGATASMGQLLFSPPSVAGWDQGPAWLSSNAMRARFVAANLIHGKGGPAEVKDKSLGGGMSGEDQIALARRALGDPEVSRSTLLVLRRLADGHPGPPEALQRSLRHLILTAPDAQVC